MKTWTKIIALTLVWVIFFYTSQAQDKFKKKKYIYELDITKSMCGYGESENILKPVIKQLSEAIENINDPSAEIVLSTFQDNILNTWKCDSATEANKKKLIEHLKDIDCKTLNVTNTNTFAAWSDAKEHIDDKKMNIVFILTDGQHNSKKNSRNQMLDQISSWDNLGLDKYAFLVQLTKEAIDQDVISKVEKTKNVQIINGIEFYILQLKEPLSILNIDDELAFELDLIKDNWKKTLDDLNVTLNLDNSNFRLSKNTLEISTLPTNIELKPITSIDNLKKNLPKKSSLNISISLDDKKYPQVKLLDNQVEVQINNKKEKVLKIWVEE